MRRTEIDITGLRKEALIEALKVKLNLPAYCQANWDSVEACLHDAELSQIKLVHVGQSALSASDLEHYRSILERWMGESVSCEVAFC